MQEQINWYRVSLLLREAAELGKTVALPLRTMEDTRPRRFSRDEFQQARRVYSALHGQAGEQAQGTQHAAFAQKMSEG